MSETPRTDLSKFAMPMSWIATTERKQYVVPAETAERMETELAAALAANQRLEKERDEATEELIRVCHALECTAQEARSISSRADSIMRSWKEAKSEVASRDERIATLVESWNDEHREACRLRAQVASLTAERDEARRSQDEVVRESAIFAKCAHDASKAVLDIQRDRDRLIADMVTLRKALEHLHAQLQYLSRSTGLLGGHATRLAAMTSEALATEHPGAPFVAAVGQAREALKKDFDRFTALGRGGWAIDCAEALALLAPFAPTK